MGRRDRAEEAVIDQCCCGALLHARCPKCGVWGGTIVCASGGGAPGTSPYCMLSCACPRCDNTTRPPVDGRERDLHHPGIKEGPPR